MLRSDPRIHYKMYKAKKNMVYATLFSFAVLGGLGFSQNAKADTVENTNVTPTVQTTVNSAQSTTGATPQPMPTQSAVPTQSSAADVNAVNSTPTAQPVPAQPVVNSQDDSASKAANQTPTTTLNVQPVQPAQKFAVTNQANLYTQSLVQVPNQTAAQNVQAQISLTNPHDGTTHDSVAWGNGVSTNLQLNFDIDSSQIKAGNRVNVGQYVHQANSNGWAPSPIIENLRNLPLRIGSTTYGHIALTPIQYNPGYNSQNNYYRGATAYTVSAIFDKNVTGLQGLQHFTISSTLALGDGYKNSPKIFLPGETQHTYPLIFQDMQGKKLSQLDLTWTPGQYPVATNLTKTGWVTSYSQGDNLRTDIAAWAGYKNLNDLNYQTNDINHVTQIHNLGDYADAGINITKPANTTFLSASRYTSAQMAFNYYVYDSQGRRHTEVFEYWAGNVPMERTADNLSLDQLKALNFTGVAVSYQNNGSVNVYDHIPTSAFLNSVHLDNIKQILSNESWTINNDSNPKQALDNTLKAINNHVFQLELPVSFYLADPSVATESTSNLVSSNFGAPAQTRKATKAASSIMASGQAAVKLHVINATNGTELNQWSKLIDEARYGK